MCDDFREGILTLNTRQFGRVVEILIKFIYKQKESNKLSYDLQDDGVRIEVKGSRVYRKNYLKLDEDNLYELIISNSNKNRLLKKEDITKIPFDCNIQQIKRTYFDYMYYVLFFYDKIEIFKIPSTVISEDKDIFYSDKQHRGNKGEGQFHINNKTYNHHKEKYFVMSLSYNEIKKKLLKKN